MTIRMLRALLTAFICLSLLVGCKDQTSVEDVTFPLLIGIDLDENNQLLFSSSSPVFSNEAKTKEEQIEIKSISLRQSREEFDRRVIAMTMGGKAQAVFISKRVLQHAGWFEFLDPFYRDNKNTILPRVIMIDGKVKDIITFAPKDKPRLPTYLSQLLSTAVKRNITVKTTLRDLHRTMTDRAVTPSITRLTKEDDDLFIVGTALLKKDGTYALTLNPMENKLLSLLKVHHSGEFPFTLALPERENSRSFYKHDKTSFTASSVSSGTKVSLLNGKYQYRMRLKLQIHLTEQLFPAAKGDTGQLEKQIARELSAQYGALFRKLQRAKVDPLGLGLYARAYTYQNWKKVQKHWDETLAEADIRVDVSVKIMDTGVTK
ncbi:Ger(x)C family spore germination protein [Paenibacillus sp. GCM10027626]|uniref:Ger(x)C family spore germination protein n=1 Tax=Paenibacillus sp. GCM10027626 TaxID=3273411 RepID=UPI00362F3A49